MPQPFNNQDKFPLVWIEVGRRLPRYFRNNSRLTGYLNPQLKQYLLHDKNIALPNCTNVLASSLEKSELTSEFEKIITPSQFKDAMFWKLSTSRFFYLYDLMLAMDWHQVLHLESDCLILKTDFLKDLVESNQEFLAYPTFSQDQASGAVFLVKSRKLLQEFLSHVIEKVRYEWKNDMVLLSEFAVQQKSILLPSHFNSSAAQIFDAGNLAPIFLGLDARNNRVPFSSRGVSTEISNRLSSSDLLSRERWEIKVGKSEINLTYKNINREVFELQNLHLHGKRIPASLFQLSKILQRGFKGKRTKIWYLGHLDINVFAERITSFVWRKFLKRGDFTKINFR